MCVCFYVCVSVHMCVCVCEREKVCVSMKRIIIHTYPPLPYIPVQHAHSFIHSNRCSITYPPTYHKKNILSDAHALTHTILPPNRTHRSPARLRVRDWCSLHLICTPPLLLFARHLLCSIYQIVLQGRVVVVCVFLCFVAFVVIFLFPVVTYTSDGYEFEACRFVRWD